MMRRQSSSNSERTRSRLNDNETFARGTLFEKGGRGKLGASNSPSVSEVFWQAENTREREREREVVGTPSPCSLSKFCCPAQSDKEATGAASSVSSLINLLIRLIQQCFNGGKPSPLWKVSYSARELQYISFPFFLSPSGSLCVLYDYLYAEVKGGALNRMPRLALKCLKKTLHQDSGSSADLCRIASLI